MIHHLLVLPGEVHESTVSNAEGDNNCVRVQVLTNAGALDRAKQLDAVSRLTADVAEAAGDPTIVDRTWVQLTETYDGVWRDTRTPTTSS